MRWEIRFVQAVRAVTAVWAAGTCVVVPVLVGATVYGAWAGVAGAQLSGVAVPVAVEAALPPRAVQGSGFVLPMQAPRVDVQVAAGTLPVLPATICAVLWAIAVSMIIMVLLRLYRLSDGVLKEDRFDGRLADRVGVLGAWIAVATVLWSASQTLNSVIATSTLDDPAVHVSWVSDAVPWGLGLAAVVLLLASALRAGTALQIDNDLTV